MPETTTPIGDCHHGVPGHLQCGACAAEGVAQFVQQDIDATLAERASRYGSFTDHARVTQRLKWAMQTETKWQQLSDDQKEALEMIAHKIGRILNGEPDYHDSWHDIIGYTKLVADRLARAA